MAKVTPSISFPRTIYSHMKKHAKRLHLTFSKYVVLKVTANSTKLTHAQLRRLKARYLYVKTEYKYINDKLSADSIFLANMQNIAKRQSIGQGDVSIQYVTKLGQCLKHVKQTQKLVKKLPVMINGIDLYNRENNNNYGKDDKHE